MFNIKGPHFDLTPVDSPLTEDSILVCCIPNKYKKKLSKMNNICHNKEDKRMVKELITLGSKIASLFDCEEMCRSKTDLARVLRVDSFALCIGAWNMWELPGGTCLI